MHIPNILLVNDDYSTLTALKAILSASSTQHNYKILEAQSGEEALRLVLKNQFAVILLDISMPSMDGFETAQLIHSRKLSAHTPIIFITAYYADEMNRLKGYELGAVDFMPTPIIPQILLTKVEVFVELAKKNLVLESKTQELAQLNKNLKVKQFKELKIHNQRLELEVEDRKIAERKAHELATKDSLTGLINRRSLISGLDNLLVESIRRKEHFAIMFLDLNRFKIINDTLGHDVGDQLLTVAAHRLQSCVRESDLVARLGGDEFVIVLSNITCVKYAVNIAKKLSLLTEDPVHIGSHSVNISFSIGISLFPEDGNTVHTLMKNADLAMYHAKREKTSFTKLYSNELNSNLIAQQKLEQELHLALQREEFVLHYQPKVNLFSNQLAGLEALIRWHHPTRGLLESNEFIGAAIECGIIVKIGDWVINKACEQINKWNSAEYEILNVPIAVNLAIPQIRFELLETINNAFIKFNVDPKFLQLEITESLLIGNLESTKSLLSDISDKGITIAIDDFGTGYSSLFVLKSLPINVLKIDQSFIKNIVNDVNDSIIVNAIVNMGHALGLLIIAEGVETIEQYNIVKELGCDEHQGYFFSKPLSPIELENRMHDFENAKLKNNKKLNQIIINS